MLAQEEAAQLLSDAVREMASGTFDLKSIMRRCQHAAELVGWTQARDWFQRELCGYPGGFALPLHRQIAGVLTWREAGPLYDRYMGAIEDAFHDHGPEFRDESATLDVFADLDWLQAVAQTGYSETAGEVAERWSAQRQRNVAVNRVRAFDAAAFARALKAIERHTFDWASRSYAILRYGNTLTDVWSIHRQGVDAALEKLKLSAHLSAIQGGLQGSDGESWRAATLACRNLLRDFAAALWLDEREVYRHLSGKGEGGHLDVTTERYLNRIAAYLHQKGLRGTTGAFLRTEIDRLDGSFRALNALESKAKASISLLDAQLAALSTYILIGEVALRTDLEPIVSYGEPARSSD